MSVKKRGGGTGKFVEKKLTSDKNLFSAKYFHKMLHHQTTRNQTKINELNIVHCYNYELMRPSKGIINLANLRTMFGYLFEEIQFTANAKGLSAKESRGGTKKFVEKRLILDKNLLSAKYFHKVLYHQTSANMGGIDFDREVFRKNGRMGWRCLPCPPLWENLLFKALTP